MLCLKVIVSLLLLLFSAASIAEETVKQTLLATYQKYKTLQSGKNADYIPELAKVNPNLFAIAIATVDGKIESVGDANIPFAIESISKPFVYMLALKDYGEKVITDKVGLNATGFPFNSVIAIEMAPHHLQNALVNAGAIQVTSFIKGKTSDEKWQRVLNFIKQLSDGKPYLGQTVYQSESATNQHNQAIAELLNSYDLMNSDARDAVDRYTKACSIMVTAKQLAIMGATLANGGIHPLTHQRLIEQQYVRDALAQMVTNGLYENSGAWWFNVGIPAKSGVGGGILAVIPQKGAIVVFSPRLDTAGNSVRGQAVIKELSEKWKLHLLKNN
jgi:glutaminase